MVIVIAMFAEYILFRRGLITIFIVSDERKKTLKIVDIYLFIKSPEGFHVDIFLNIFFEKYRILNGYKT